MRSVALIVGIALLAGCHSTMDTASGRPEVVMAASPAEAKAAIIGTYINLGNSLTKDTTYQVVIQEAGLSPTAQLWLGPGTDYRMTFTLLPAAEKTRVIGEGIRVQNAGTNSEQLIPLESSAPDQRMQSILNNIAAGFAAGHPVDQIVTETVTIAKQTKSPTAAAL